MTASPHLQVVRSHLSIYSLQMSIQETFSEREEGIAKEIFESENPVSNRQRKISLFSKYLKGMGYMKYS
jgi:hypothetical protein